MFAISKSDSWPLAQNEYFSQNLIYRSPLTVEAMFPKFGFDRFKLLSELRAIDSNGRTAAACFSAS
jgi:hypothetical protein